MKKRTQYIASKTEIDYVKALSRESTIEAYINWAELSDAESLLIDLFINENARVLDLGCGTGRIPKLIKVKADSYLGIDCSPEMIKAAKTTNPNFKFICEDILAPNTKLDVFDVVLLMNNVVDMLHPIQRRKDIFNLVKKYLTPKGVLIFSSHLLHKGNKANYYQEDYHGAKVSTYRSTFHQLCEEVENLGFEIMIVTRDYRTPVADWAYVAANVR